MQAILLQPNSNIVEAFSPPRGVTAIVGGGGKTTLMLRLARELREIGARVIVSTTTHIFPPDQMPVLIDPSFEQAQSVLEAEGIVCVGCLAENGKLSAPSMPICLMEQLADYVLLEADGAKCLPLKAPAAHEPVIPAETRLVIAVAGLDGVGKPISQTVFRPALYAVLCGKSEEETVTARDVALVLSDSNGQHKNVVNGMRFAILLNKADNAERIAEAENIVRSLKQNDVERVVIASLQHAALDKL